jgi:NAD(P)-dependent dehydrogenase (short-subunit alcohol dehydrogenase family)
MATENDTLNCRQTHHWRDSGTLGRAYVVNNLVISGRAGLLGKALRGGGIAQCRLGSHFVASYTAAPQLIANGRGLIVNTGHYGAVSYFRGPVYGAQKAGADEMAADMAKELRPHNVAAVSIWMGGLDTERARAYLASLPPESRPTAKRESPEFTGRIIATLYDSDQRMQLSGRVLIGARLGPFSV